MPDSEPSRWALAPRFAWLGIGRRGRVRRCDRASRAVARVVDNIVDHTRNAPALIILEDVHLADEASLALLQFFVGALPELRCALLLTSRDNAIDLAGPAAEAVQKLPPAISRLTLGGLDRASSAAIVAGILGAVDSTTVDELRPQRRKPVLSPGTRPAAGTPRCVAVGYTSGVGQVLGRRLARLNQRTHECLSAAAVLGDDAEIQILAEVLDVPVAVVLDLLGGAAEARLAVVDGSRVHFAHALVREVLLDELSPSLRSSLHLRAGHALVGTCCTSGRHTPHYGLPLAPCCSLERVQASAGEVADHFRRAIGVQGSAELAREHALSAARIAVRRSGYEQAVRFYQWAIEGDGAPELRVEYGEALVLAGQMGEGRAQLRLVAHDAIAVEDGELAARAVLAMGGAGGFEVDLFDSEQTALLDAALMLLPEGDSAVKAAALARLALGRAHGRMDTVSRSTTREAIEMARRIGDARTEATAIAAGVTRPAAPSSSPNDVTRPDACWALPSGAANRPWHCWRADCSSWPCWRLAISRSPTSTSLPMHDPRTACGCRTTPGACRCGEACAR
jgi:hypothetical protein